MNSIIKLGQDLNKDIIAQGIEQLEDLYLLESQNCTKYQGFLFSPPLTLSAFEKYLQKENLLSTVFHRRILDSINKNGMVRTLLTKKPPKTYGGY